MLQQFDRLMSRRPHFFQSIMVRAHMRARAFARDERGVTIVEFGILAIPFFTLIFAVLETAMVFFASAVLDSAVEDASRWVLTGRAQSANWDINTFRDRLCDSTFGLFGSDCAEIKIKVSVINTFAAATLTAPQTCQTTPTPQCTWTLVDGFQPGVGRDIVQVQAYYRWPLVVVLPYFNLKDQPDNYRLLSGVRVFRNEPFT